MRRGILLLAALLLLTPTVAAEPLLRDAAAGDADEPRPAIRAAARPAQEAAAPAAVEVREAKEAVPDTPSEDEAEAAVRQTVRHAAMTVRAVVDEASAAVDGSTGGGCDEAPAAGAAPRVEDLPAPSRWTPADEASTAPLTDAGEPAAGPAATGTSFAPVAAASSAAGSVAFLGTIATAGFALIAFGARRLG